MELYLGEIPMKPLLNLYMSFSNFDHPSSPLRYKSLEIIKLTVAIFMYKYHYHLLPSAF